MSANLSQPTPFERYRLQLYLNILNSNSFKIQIRLGIQTKFVKWNWKPNSSNKIANKIKNNIENKIQTKFKQNWKWHWKQNTNKIENKIQIKFKMKLKTNIK
jgi:hypothetical protein